MKTTHERFDEKFNNASKAVVTIESLDGFNEQKPASEEIKTFIDQIIDRTTTHVLSQVDEVLEKQKVDEKKLSSSIVKIDGAAIFQINKAIFNAQEAIKLIK